MNLIEQSLFEQPATVSASLSANSSTSQKNCELFDTTTATSLGSCPSFVFVKPLEQSSFLSVTYGQISIAPVPWGNKLYIKNYVSLKKQQGLPLVCQLHILAEGRALMMLRIDGAPEQIKEIYQKCRETPCIVLASFTETTDISQENDIVLVAEANNFLVYCIPQGCMTQSDNLMQKAQLALAVGVEETLVSIYNLDTRPPPREVECAMLTEFDKNNCVSLPGGAQVVAVMEPTIDFKDDSEPPPEKRQKKQHPVLRLQSPEGEVVFTKFSPTSDGENIRSLMVHIRPGWNEFRRYMSNAAPPSASNNNSATSSSGPESTRHPFFRVHPVFKQKWTTAEACELWRILDKRGSLFSDIPSRVCANLERLSLDLVLKRSSWDIQLAFGLDSSGVWHGAGGLSKIWPMRVYNPYVAPFDFGLANILHAFHTIRNTFYERGVLLRKEIKAWIDKSSEDSFESMNHPSIPNIEQILQLQKNTWLQEFQAPQSHAVSKELAMAKDYSDPILRPKWHMIIDTNVLHHCASDNFEFFKTLEHTHGKSIVLVIPFATVQELDWQKHNVRDSEKLGNATASIRFLNSQAAAGSKFIVMQSVEEDEKSKQKHKNVRPFNAQNDMRVFDSAKIRHNAGLKTLVISGDTNLRNICMSSRIPSVKFQNLWQMLGNRRYQKLEPDQWLKVLQGNEKAKQDKILKTHHNKQLAAR